MKGSLRQQSLKKCVEISSLGIDEFDARVEHGNSKKKEDCKNASYWEEKYPKENVFVSYYQSECLYDLDRHVTLVPNPNQMLIIYSSCDQTDVDSTLIGNINKAVEIGKAKQSQEDGNYDRNFIIYVSAGGVGVLILIATVNVAVIRKIKKNVVDTKYIKDFF